MDMNAYHIAWMSGATEAEAVRAGEDACFENQAYAAREREAYEAIEREAYEHEQRMIAEHESNSDLDRSRLPNTKEKGLI